MQRTATLRGILAAASTIILPEAHPSPINQRNACANPIPVRLHPLQVHLDETVPVSVVLKEEMESLCTISVNGRRANSVLQNEIEKSVVVIISPSRDFVRGGG